MTTPQPRIGYPRLGTPTESALNRAGASLIEQHPLPVLTEPLEPKVTDPIDQPMVRVDGLQPRIEEVHH